MNDQQRAAMQADPYNGDDGPGFDYEFHAKLLAGAHLMSDEQRKFFYIGWEAGRKFEREALAQPQEPEKKWVGLTDEEYDLCCQGTQPLNVRVRMVAMALKNKNAGE